jgi:hypothetical protein
MKISKEASKAHNNSLKRASRPIGVASEPDVSATF